MFASAAREVVFSNPEAVRRINENFVPVALKAASINNPPDGIEGRLYAEIARSKPAPQGICVANSAGKALAWVLSFDDDDSIALFLDHAASRYREFPDAEMPVATERFRKYPGHELGDVADTGEKITAPARHAHDDRCPGRPAVEPGTLVGRIVGRALDEDGNPLVDTLRQEHYMESRIAIPPATQSRFIDAARQAAGERFALPDPLARALAGPAYLGQLDVNPMGDVPGSRNDLYEAEFHARRIASESGGMRYRIEGVSKVEGSQDPSGRSPDGRVFEHRVVLDWEGYIEMRDEHITELVMLANGRERLRWGNSNLRFTSEPAAAHLMAGHAIDLDCGARYGLIAGPANAEEVAGEATLRKDRQRSPGPDPQ